MLTTRFRATVGHTHHPNEALTTYWCRYRPEIIAEREWTGLGLTQLSGSQLRACDLTPTLEPFPHLLTICGGRQTMSAWSKVWGNRTICGEEPLGMPRRLKAPHAPFPLARRLVGVLGAAVQVAVLAVLHPGQNLPLRGTVAREFIRDDDPRDIRW